MNVKFSPFSFVLFDIFFYYSCPDSLYSYPVTGLATAVSVLAVLFCVLAVLVAQISYSVLVRRPSKILLITIENICDRCRMSTNVMNGWWFIVVMVVHSSR